MTMRTTTACFIALAALLLASCNKMEKKVKDYAIEFASKVRMNDAKSVQDMYPAAELCDSFALDFQEDSIKLVKEPDGYVVKFSDDRSMLVTVNEDGSMAIESSYGLFAFDPDLVNFALRTGWIEPDLNDSTIAARLQDYEFLDFMVDRFSRELKQKVTSAKVGYFGQSFADRSSFKSIVATVSNRTDYDIPGEAYKVLYRVVYWAFPEDNETKQFEGKDIPAGGSITFRGTKRGTGEPTESGTSVKFNEDQLPQLCLQIYKGNGHEYADFKEGLLN